MEIVLAVWDGRSGSWFSSWCAEWLGWSGRVLSGWVEMNFDDDVEGSDQERSEPMIRGRS